MKKAKIVQKAQGTLPRKAGVISLWYVPPTKTKHSSYLYGKFTKGCKLCVKGQKMVLFVTGLCSRGCKFCPLSKMRKSVDKIYANERLISTEDAIQEIIEEVKVSGAKGCSLTGGDPLLKMGRTIKLASTLKKKFGKKFHIHIYVSTKLVTEKRLEKLSKCVDEIRFHPYFDKPIKDEIKKIKLAQKFWKKKNIGVEIPCFPDKVEKIIAFVKEVSPYISFLNMNELESGEYSEKHMSKKYKLTEDGYTIKDSITAGKYIIHQLIGSLAHRLSIHLCTAELKNNHQYKNRLKNYKIPKFFKKTEDGTVIYFAIQYNKECLKTLSAKESWYDKTKNRIILSPKLALKSKDIYKVYRIEEYPTYEREECEVSVLE
jgi:pyruvate formate-lyase activating enzyme-like uncharacterized protein